MPKIQATTATGEQAIEAPEGKKLVLVIEDAGIDIMHRCGGNARCTTCRVQVVNGEPEPMQELEQTRLPPPGAPGPARPRGDPGPGHPALLPDPREFRPGRPRPEPGRRRGGLGRTAPRRLNGI